VSETLTPELEPRRPAAGGMRAPGRWLRLGALLAIAVALSSVLWLRLAALRRVARTSGGKTFDLPDGGLAVVDAQYPKSIHVAYPGSPYQVEVFGPSPARARALVTGDAVQAIG
jgi:hypothetical protein